MRTDPKTKLDGYVNFLGGVDSGRVPNLLAENQLAFAVNCTCRGGQIATRPGFKKMVLTFEDTEVSGFWESEINRFQGADFYNNDIICSIAGRIFRVITATWNVVEITPRSSAVLAAASITPPTNGSKTFTLDQVVTAQEGYPAWINGEKYTITDVSGIYVTVTNINAVPGVSLPVGSVFEYGDANSSAEPLAWMVQAEQYFIIQDGVSPPIIYDGSSRRSLVEKFEVPVGTVMAYGMGRLWVATEPRKFVAGDIVGGDSEVIKFTENDYLNTGGRFAVPSDVGSITGMVFLPNLDTSLGQGPLLVFTENAIFSVNAPVERETWKNLTNPIQTVSLDKYGTTGHFSIQPVNGDLFYRSPDGVRSFILARRDFGTWGNVPVSREIDRVMGDDKNMLKFCSSVLFDNRLFVTVGVVKDRTGAYFNGIASIDFDLISAMGQKAPPVWEGVWTGLRFTRIIVGSVYGINRMFSFSVNADGENELWEITKDDLFDEDGCKIPAFIETRSFNHGTPFESSELETLELWMDDLHGEVDWEVKYRPDQYPCWYLWKTFTQTQTTKDCTVGTVGDCWVPTEYKPGYRTRIALPKPASVCEDNDNKPSTVGYEFQLRISWSGRARIKRVMMINRELEERVTGNLVC